MTAELRWTKNSTSAVSAWVAHRKPKPQARLRLYCLPYAGGSASVFRTWADGLPAGIDVWPIQYPGRENRLRERPINSVSGLVDTLGQALEPTLEAPYAIFGHSMGGLVGFELARWLAARQRAPLHLFVSGSRAPHRADPDVRIHDLPDAQFVEALRRLKGTPEPVLQNPELMELLSPALRADFEAVETYRYRPGPPLDCPISAFAGRDDQKVSEADITAWKEQTRERFRFRQVPGDHFFVRTAPQPLLWAIAQDLHVAW
ncbi:MAG: thioesterase [Anaerolineales bacterium]|nr:thioesterase [Anaerolineales bacterium]